MFVIDEYEGREVATFHFPGAYLQADMLKDIYILNKIKSNIRGYNLSDQAGAQE